MGLEINLSVKGKINDNLKNFLKENRSRSEIRNYLNVCDSKAREEIGKIRKDYPVVSGKNLMYYRAITNNNKNLTIDELAREIAEIDITLAENISRIRELKANNKPLLKRKQEDEELLLNKIKEVKDNVCN